jgi:polygalacturonase
MTFPYLNVRDFGAVGDGKTDDTAALRAAIDALPGSGAMLSFPPGHYVTDTLFPKDFTTLRGDSAFGYQEPGGTILSPVKPTMARLIDMNGRRGVRLEGLTLHGLDQGDDMVGVYISRATRNEQHNIIERCRVEHFSGSGVVLNESHVFTLRHSIFMCNRGDGVDAGTSFDGWIQDCMFTANGHAGLTAGNSIVINGCRIEHNKHVGLACNRHYSMHLQVTGNLFCSDCGPAIEMLEGNVRAIAITGNTIRNAGREQAGDPDRYCQVRLLGVQGLTFTGNVLHILWQDHPGTGMILHRLTDSVVANNSLFKGATQELIRDLGGHINTVIENNPGSLKRVEDID